MLAHQVSSAAPRVLRLATPAPDGTAPARLLKALAREVDKETKGELRIKWYWGGVAGDELTVHERIKREQLDGTASGGPLCMLVSPSLRISQLPGVFQTREEARHVVTLLRPTLEAEALQRGFTLFTTVGLGPTVLLTRTPIRTLSDLKGAKLWIWDLLEVQVAVGQEIGISVVSSPLHEAGSLYDSGRTDGFLTIPTAALAFQWSARARYVTDLRIGYVHGCLLIANRAVDPLSQPQRQALQSAVNRSFVHFEELGLQQDRMLLGGVFARQGLKAVPVSETLRAEVFAALRAARERLGEKLVPAALLHRVMEALSDYRGAHP